MIKNIKKVLIDTLTYKLLVFDFNRLFHLNAHFTAPLRKANREMIHAEQK